jgi:hypothetical protein
VTNLSPSYGSARARLHLVPTSPRQPRTNLLVLWHLLSLDAPTVAALWTWFLARINHVDLPASSVAAMALAVWLLYAGDRLLDARQLQSGSQNIALEPRHHFHHHHRQAFRIGIAAASVSLAILLPHLAPEAIRLYLIEGSFLAGYFILIHATQSAHRLPKELAVGLFFAAATFIPTVAREPSLRLSLLAPAVLFAALCSLNCLFIYAWEHPRSTHAEAHPATRLALRHLRFITLVFLAASLACALLDEDAPRRLTLAIAVAITLLLVLHTLRGRFSATLLRATADLALLTPLLFLPLR